MLKPAWMPQRDARTGQDRTGQDRRGRTGQVRKKGQASIGRQDRKDRTGEEAQHQ
jgi:hypothetical protein